ncbi:unnamed protein product [Rhizophagus irregularis]|nr:unnamed protein product [Rhizophagus irregularis]
MMHLAQKYHNSQVAEGSPKIINEPDKRFDAKYDKNFYHDLDYIRFALLERSIMIILRIKIWKRVVRGESTSLASADRKNAQRIMPERRNMGHRGDLL